MKAPQRSKSLQIYVKPGIREDDILLDIWDACARFDRPQDVFRTMLRRGMIAMVESGDMPKAVIDACGLDAIVDSILERRSRKSGRARREDQVPAYPPQTYAPQTAYVPYPPQPQYQPYPAQGYASQPDNGQWSGGHETRPARPPEYDRAPEPPRAAPEAQRPPETDRRAIEEKVPTEPPRAVETPVPEKRQDPAPKPPSTPAIKKQLGDLM